MNDSASTPDESRQDLLGGGAPHSLRELSHRVDSYGFLLIVLVLLIWVVIPLTGAGRTTGLLTSAVALWTITIALRASVASVLRQAILMGMAVAAFALIAVGTVGDHDSVQAVGHVLLAIPYLASASLVLRRVFSHTVVTGRTIAGAVCVYLIAALAFAQLYIALDLVDGAAFNPGSDPLGTANLQYFSLVTIATLGYGDITPASDAARTLATLETVMGQIYLVVIVARLVSTFGQEARPADVPNALSEDDPPPAT